MKPQEIYGYIKKNRTHPKAQEKIVKGYRVKVTYSETDSESIEEAQKTIAKTLLDSLKKKRK